METNQKKQADQRWLDFCDDLNNYYGGEFVDYLLENLGINKLEGQEHDKAIIALHNLHKYWRDELDYDVNDDGSLSFKEIDRTERVNFIALQ